MDSTIFTRAFDRRVRTLLAVLGISVVVGGAFGTHTLWQANLEQGYMPAQPIDFSHAVMAGKHNIDCLYCHTQALKGPHAGLPTVSDCMKCHKEIQTKDAEGKLKHGLARLNEHWREKKPIEWVKVHDLADFAYFDHSRHLQPHTGLWCQDCHGDIEKMDRVKRVNSLKMGWCLECHMQAPTATTPAGWTTRAPINCSTCHR
ncbi:MAG: cytochrome c3 family protein [Planctomycetota bacterium]|nr:cytochrome c3 family protein [Planctomycetota bacterium]